jgi:hypothetical protein
MSDEEEGNASDASVVIAAIQANDHAHGSTNDEPHGPVGELATEEAREGIRDRIGGVQTEEQQDDPDNQDGEGDGHFHGISLRRTCGGGEQQTPAAQTPAEHDRANRRSSTTDSSDRQVDEHNKVFCSVVMTPQVAITLNAGADTSPP